MLSSEHVRVRRDGDRLILRELSGRQHARAVELAEALLETTRSQVGKTRDEVEQAWSLVETSASERRLVDGLKKLLEDACEFEQAAVSDPAALRSEVFLRAAAARRASSLELPFSRDAVLEASAEPSGLTRAAVEVALYADLRGEHELKSAPALAAEALVIEYERAQVQALLLRAVKVVATVHCQSPEAYRALFQKLKWRRLLFEVARIEGGGYRLIIDGPFSLFEAVTKYGLELALTLPVLEACDVLELTAELAWGKTRQRLRFEYRHVSSRTGAPEALELRDDVRELMQEFAELGSDFRCARAEEILNLPGVGLCIPDLVFQRGEGEEPVYVELLGYWSRDAVWRRIELVEEGLLENIVFLASSKLRVSEEALESENAALYVFRGRPNARALERKLVEVAERARSRREAARAPKPSRAKRRR